MTVFLNAAEGGRIRARILAIHGEGPLGLVFVACDDTRYHDPLRPYRALYRVAFDAALVQEGARS